MKKNKNKEPQQQWIQLKEVSPSSNMYSANMNDSQLMFGENQSKNNQIHSNIQQPKQEKISSINTNNNSNNSKNNQITQNSQNNQIKPQLSNQNRQTSNKYPTYPINQNQSKNSNTNINQPRNPYNQFHQAQNNNQNRNQNNQSQRSKIPTMQVACDYCTLQQKIPGNAQIYSCSACENINQCYPLYGIFICGTCKAHVCYGFGTSEFIRCTRCGMVNKVPSEPIFNYKRGTYKKNIPKNNQIKKQKKQQIIQIDERNTKIVINQNKKQSQVVEVDFFGQQNYDNSDLPQRPKQSNNQSQKFEQEVQYDELKDIKFQQQIKYQEKNELKTESQIIKEKQLYQEQKQYYDKKNDYPDI